MNGIEILTDLTRRPLDAAEHLRERLTPELLNAHPHHDNSIAWLLWHAAREIDEQLSALSGREPVWTADGFDRRFGLATGAHELGYGHSAEEARAIRADDADLLLDHLGAVVAAQLAYLSELDEASLAQVVDDRWDPPVTRGSRLVSMSADALEHVGQAAYIAGMSRDAFEGGRA